MNNHLPGNRPLSRRQFLTWAAASATLVGGGALLTACGSKENSSQPQGPTRTVIDAYDKEITVPDKPTRIVALSEPTLDGILALGITPVGTISGRGQQTAPSYLLDKAQDIPLLGTVSQLNFEAIGAANPDLIVVDGTSVNNNQPVLDTLAAIAPTVFCGYAGGDWKTNLQTLAQAVGVPETGEQVIADYATTTSQLKEQLAPKYGDKTFSIIRWQGNSPSLILKELPAGMVLTDLGLRRPPAQDRNGRGHSDPVSLENIADIDADYMFFGTLGGSSVSNPSAGGMADSSAAEEAISQAAQLQGFASLKAYTENHIIPVDGAAWTSTGGPLLATRILTDIKTNLL